jgi:hypothetical protein
MLGAPDEDECGCDVSSLSCGPPLLTNGHVCALAVKKRGQNGSNYLTPLAKNIYTIYDMGVVWFGIQCETNK